MPPSPYYFFCFILLLVFLSPLAFALFSAPVPSLETSSCFRFLLTEVLTLTTVEVLWSALEIWLSATVQSTEFLSIAYLHSTKDQIVSLRTDD